MTDRRNTLLIENNFDVFECCYALVTPEFMYLLDKHMITTAGASWIIFEPTEPLHESFLPFKNDFKRFPSMIELMRYVQENNIALVEEVIRWEDASC